MRRVCVTTLPVLPQICNLRYDDKQAETNPADYKSAGTLVEQQ